MSVGFNPNEKALAGFVTSIFPNVLPVTGSGIFN
jgi:hypothetical protein